MIFATLATDENERRAAQFLISSIRQYAGCYRDSQILMYSTSKETTYPFRDSSGNTSQIPLSEYPANAPYFFADKVQAWVQAEVLLENQTDTLVWIDPLCLVLREPGQFALLQDNAAAFRPVHIQNIGLSSQSPLDYFWQAIYDQCNTPRQTESVESYVDENSILPYFNTHCFSINPKLGVLRRTAQNLKDLTQNSQFVETCLSDHIHKIFLFQAVLSATVLSCCSLSKIQILTPDYSYPFHFQEKITLQKRITDLSKITTLVYEDFGNLEKLFQQLKSSEEIRSWYENLNSTLSPLDNNVTS